jgi:carboxylate-amine ligase
LRGAATLPEWAAWRTAGERAPFTTGIEEEVMLLDPDSFKLRSRIDDVLAAVPPALRDVLSSETHGAALEITTRPHPSVAGAMTELEGLRAELKTTLRELGLVAAAAGTHPIATWQDVELSPGAHQQALHETMRELARREPTFALHVHVAVPDAETAVRALNRMRVHLPLLLALSANSPFWQGRDSGLASSRTAAFQTFPRTGMPRAFADYADYVEAIDVLMRCGAISSPSFVWWDARLAPRFGTIEIRSMDAQSSPATTAALAELAQALVQAECADRGLADERLVRCHAALEESRFLALRDGAEAKLLDPVAERLLPVPDVLETVQATTRAIPGLAALIEDPAPARQRRIAAEQGSLEAVVAHLAEQF